MASSGYHGMAVRDDNSMVVWGENSHGQLGIGTTRDAPQPVQESGATNWLYIAAGRMHSLAIKTDGSLWARGSNKYGQLGHEQKRFGPRHVLTP